MSLPRRHLANLFILTLSSVDVANQRSWSSVGLSTHSTRVRHFKTNLPLKVNHVGLRYADKMAATICALHSVTAISAAHLINALKRNMHENVYSLGTKRYSWVNRNVFRSGANWSRPGIRRQFLAEAVDS